MDGIFDPRGQPIVTAGSDHYYLHVVSLRSSTPHFLKSREKNTFQVRIVIATVGNVGLAEWIIYDTHVL